VLLAATVAFAGSSAEVAGRAWPVRATAASVSLLHQGCTLSGIRNEEAAVRIGHQGEQTGEQQGNPARTRP